MPISPEKAKRVNHANSVAEARLGADRTCRARAVRAGPDGVSGSHMGDGLCLSANLALSVMLLLMGCMCPSRCSSHVSNFFTACHPIPSGLNIATRG
jgi:hypothetical protein